MPAPARTLRSRVFLGGQAGYQVYYLLHSAQVMHGLGETGYADLFGKGTNVKWSTYRPFATVDQTGVGQLMKIAVEKKNDVPPLAHQAARLIGGVDNHGAERYAVRKTGS